MRLFFNVNSAVHRFAGLAVLLLFALPFGLSVAGCGHKAAPVQYCNAGDTGPVVGQIASITLAGNFATVGESLNYGQIGATLSATAFDCKGNPVSVQRFTYASTSSYNVNSAGGSIFADINPSTGQVCGGTWNRNTGGGIANYTTCTPPPVPPVSSSVPINLSAPTAATATAGSVTTLLLAQPSDFVSGILTLAVGLTGTPHSITIPADTTLTALAAQIDRDTTFAALGITAVFNPTTTVLTLTGPVGPGNTLVTTGAPQTATVAAIPGTSLNDGIEAYLALVTATANGATSNAIPVFVHPVATGITIGTATPGASNGSCPAGTADPGTDCCPNITAGTVVTAPVYTGGCISQNQSALLIARIYQGGNTLPVNNITCKAGHVQLAAQSASIVTIDASTGVVTAQKPGSSVVTATLSNSSTAAAQAGFLSTCPPASIQLSFPGNSTNTANIAVNNTQPFTYNILDTAGNPITGLSLEFISTTPTTIPASVNSVTPTFPGSADITAVCLPAGCNPAPFSQIGYNEMPFDPTGIDPSHTSGSNGKPITSNPLTVNVVGTSSTVLYMASTQSQYVQAHDFTTNQPATLIKLPFVPNSMVVNQTGTGVYFGSSEGLMSLSTANNILGTTNQSIPGVVLSISPDGGTLVVTDPVRQTISLVTTSGGVVSQYGGVATHAQWSSDAQSVYITTTTGTVLTHSTYTDWQTGPDPSNGETYTDVTVAVPAIGAYYAGPGTTDARSYCSTSSTAPGSATIPPTIDNIFLPIADSIATPTDRIAATTDGKHILGAHAVSGGAATLSDIQPSYPQDALACTIAPMAMNVAFAHTLPPPVTFTGIKPVADPTLYTPIVGTPLAITGVVPSSNSAAAFVTYTGTGGLLPAYFPATAGEGSTSLVPLNGGATAPIAGVFSTDNFSFYVGTSGDNAVHIISLTYPTGATPTAVDSGNTLTPNLPNVNGATSSPINLIVQFPKKATS